MPATLKSLTSKTNQLAVKIDDDPQAITVAYTTRKLTPRAQNEIEQALADGSSAGADSLIDQFLVVVTGWDLAAEPGQPPIELTKEALMDVPIEVLGLVMDAITVDMNPKEATDSSSNTP